MIHHAPPDAYELEYLAWYLRSTYTAGEPFDPSQLVQLARQKWKKQPALADAFARCTQQWRYGEYYTYLLAPDYLEERWQFATSVFLDHPTWGALMVDVLHDTESLEGWVIGGIEFMGRLLSIRSTLEMSAERQRLRVVHCTRYPSY